MARRISLVDISSKRRRIRRLLFWGGLLLTLLLLIAGSFWATARSSLFKIRDIQISGASYVPEDQVRSFLLAHVAQGKIKGFFGADNSLTWPGGFSEEELRDLPGISSISINKHFWSHRVSVMVMERKRLGIWCFATVDPKACYWFDSNGILFMPGYHAEGNLTPLIDDHGRDPLGLGEKVLEPRFLPNLVSIFSALRSLHLSIREVRLNDISKEEVEAYTYEGPRLLFSLRFPAAGVSDAVKAVEKAVPISKLQYIDFRVENKVYYK